MSRYEFAFNALQGLIPVLPSKIVFDIGAGDGRMRRIEDAGFSWNGFDLTPSPTITSWDLTSPCPTRDLTAGAAILLDVIEHCVNPGLALKNIAAVLEPNARLVLTMPNPRWSKSRVHALIHGYPACFTQSDLDLNHHVFPPWPHVLANMLYDAGFEIEDYVTLDGRTKLFQKPWSFFYPVKFLLRLGLITIEHADPSACGMSYGLVARRVCRESKG